MRVTTVIDDTFDLRIELTGDAESDIETALQADHPMGDDWGQCNNNTCDVIAARRHGSPLAAAWLLVGATECPATDAVLRAYAFNRAPIDLHAAFDHWCSDEDNGYLSAKSAECRGCGSPVYDVDPTDYVCGNCAHHNKAVLSVPIKDRAIAD